MLATCIRTSLGRLGRSRCKRYGTRSSLWMNLHRNLDPPASSKASPVRRARDISFGDGTVRPCRSNLIPRTKFKLMLCWRARTDRFLDVMVTRTCRNSRRPTLLTAFPIASRTRPKGAASTFDEMLFSQLRNCPRTSTIIRLPQPAPKDRRGKQGSQRTAPAGRRRCRFPAARQSLLSGTACTTRGF